MEPLDLYKKPLELINSIVFPGKNSKINIISKALTPGQYQNTTFGYAPLEDEFLYFPMTVQKWVSAIQGQAHGPGVGLVNRETDSRPLDQKLILPSFDIPACFAIMAAYQTRQRMQHQLYRGGPVISYSEYVQLKCYEDATVMAHTFARKSPLIYELLLDANAIMFIFAGQLWINNNQRGLPFDESVIVAARVLQSQPWQLRKEANKYCFLG